MSHWTGVPTEKTSAWARCFRKPSSGYAVASPCPLCGETALFRYYSTPVPVRVSVPGFQGLGGLWEWCQACRTFEHSSAMVPDWWDPSLSVADGARTATPDGLGDLVLRR